MPVEKEAHMQSKCMCAFISREMKIVSKCLQNVLNTGLLCIRNTSGIFPKHFYEYCGCGDV